MLLQQALLLVVGVMFVSLGIRLCMKRTICMDSIWWKLFVALCFLPGFLPVIFVAVQGGYTLSEMWIPAVLLLMFVVVIWFIGRTMGHLVILNISEDGLYDSVMAVLRDRGYGCHESRSQIHLDDYDTSIKVNIQAMIHTASLEFVNKKDIDDWSEVKSALKERMSSNQLTQFPVAGVVYIVLGVILIAISLGTGILLP